MWGSGQALLVPSVVRRDLFVWIKAGRHEPGELNLSVLQSCLDTTQPQIMMMVFSIVRLIVVSSICVWMVGILAAWSVSDDCR